MFEALVLLSLLMLKHIIGDFFLQSDFILENRHRYGHLGGVIHVGIHALGTAIVISLISPVILVSLIVILIAEAVVHYHIDWAKDNLVNRMGYGVDDKGYWWLLGVDQYLHHLTYVAIVWYLLG